MMGVCGYRETVLFIFYIYFALMVGGFSSTEITNFTFNEKIA